MYVIKTFFLMLMPWISVSKTYFKFQQIIKIMFEKVGC